MLIIEKRFKKQKYKDLLNIIESETRIYNLVKEIIRDNNQKLNSLNIINKR